MPGSAIDIAAYICGETRASSVALQKLLYYCRGWVEAETGEACFDDHMEAWRMGPVAPKVRDEYATLTPSSGASIPPHHRAVIDDVLGIYGQLDGDALSEASHAEPGWLRARRGLAPSDRGNQVIDFNLVVRYLREAAGDSRNKRMRSALLRSKERAQLRRVLEPHRESMLRLAQ
jgi:uncharacterized phage-associated protein